MWLELSVSLVLRSYIMSPTHHFALISCILTVLFKNIYPFRRQNLTPIDVRCWRPKSIPELKELRFYNSRRPIGNQMKQKDLIKTVMKISNWKKTPVRAKKNYCVGREALRCLKIILWYVTFTILWWKGCIVWPNAEQSVDLLISQC